MTPVQFSIVAWTDPESLENPKATFQEVTFPVAPTQISIRILSKYEKEENLPDDQSLGKAYSQTSLKVNDQALEKSTFMGHREFLIVEFEIQASDFKPEEKLTTFLEALKHCLFENPEKNYLPPFLQLNWPSLPFILESWFGDQHDIKGFICFEKNCQFSFQYPALEEGEEEPLENDYNSSIALHISLAFNLIKENSL